MIRSASAKPVMELFDKLLPAHGNADCPSSAIEEYHGEDLALPAGKRFLICAQAECGRGAIIPDRRSKSQNLVERERCAGGHAGGGGA